MLKWLNLISRLLIVKLFPRLEGLNWTYLEEPKLEYGFLKKLDVLNYWKDNKNWFPELSRMVCGILSVPITIVASKYAFNIGAHVLSKYKSCLLPKNVQALIYTWSWLHKFIPYGTIQTIFSFVKFEIFWIIFFFV